MVVQGVVPHAFGVYDLSYDGIFLGIDNPFSSGPARRTISIAPEPRSIYLGFAGLAVIGMLTRIRSGPRGRNRAERLS